MNDLIQALTIFAKYGDPRSPTHCEHDVLYVMINPEDVSEEDKGYLSKLSFEIHDSYECFVSYRFGST